jgi:hypothetical protein
LPISVREVRESPGARSRDVDDKDVKLSPLLSDRLHEANNVILSSYIGRISKDRTSRLSLYLLSRFLQVSLITRADGDTRSLASQ